MVLDKGPVVQCTWCFIQTLVLGQTSCFVHGLAPLTCRTHQKLRGLHPSAVVSLQPPVSDPGAPNRHRAGPKWTVIPEYSSASSAPPPLSAAAPAVQTSLQPFGANDNMNIYIHIYIYITQKLLGSRCYPNLEKQSHSYILSQCHECFVQLSSKFQIIHNLLIFGQSFLKDKFQREQVDRIYPNQNRQMSLTGQHTNTADSYTLHYLTVNQCNI